MSGLPLRTPSAFFNVVFIAGGNGAVLLFASLTQRAAIRSGVVTTILAAGRIIRVQDCSLRLGECQAIPGMLLGSYNACIDLIHAFNSLCYYYPAVYFSESSVKLRHEDTARLIIDQLLPGIGSDYGQMGRRYPSAAFIETRSRSTTAAQFKGHPDSLQTPSKAIYRALRYSISGDDLDHANFFSSLRKLVILQDHTAERTEGNTIPFAADKYKESDIFDLVMRKLHLLYMGSGHKHETEAASLLIVNQAVVGTLGSAWEKDGIHRLLFTEMQISGQRNVVKQYSRDEQCSKVPEAKLLRMGLDIIMIHTVKATQC
ncbi:hypothetical protein CPC08DRAFT_783614 [Agrocybe pediades]|nr:hypothetical protein CPC08DRAFT_783614 [Agrocybe pediades]